MFLDPLVIVFSSLFGCRRVILTDAGGYSGLDNVVAILKKMGAVKIGESGLIDFANYFFKVDGKWVVLVVQEYEEIKLIAPEAVIKRIQHELHDVGRSL